MSHHNPGIGGLETVLSDTPAFRTKLDAAKKNDKHVVPKEKARYGRTYWIREFGYLKEVIMSHCREWKYTKTPEVRLMLN